MHTKKSTKIFNRQEFCIEQAFHINTEMID